MQDDRTSRSSRTDWAEDRTDWAEDRTLLANERTFAGWMRTGMTALAVAIGLHAVFGELQPPWIAKATATMFIIVAILVFAAAAQRSHKAQLRIDSHDSASQPAWRMTALAVILCLASLATGGVLWMV
jgi:putative membrane protein